MERSSDGTNVMAMNQSLFVVITHTHTHTHTFTQFGLLCSIPVVPKLFRSTAPLVPYTHPQRPLPFLKKHKCAFVPTYIVYLKNRLNKVTRVKLNVLCVN
jgi:hypothetical protein